MTAEQILQWLEHSAMQQREKLSAVRAHYVGVIRELYDDDHQRVVRELKKRINSKKLAADLAAVLVEIARDRTAKPRGPVVPAIVEDLPVVDGDRRAQLEAAIAADPDAQAPYLPYADWLEAHGDAFGPLIAIDRELAKNPGHKAMKVARKDHVSAHRREILGALLDEDNAMASYRLDKGSYRGVGEIEWHMGFIRRCRVTSWFEKRGLPSTPIAHVLRALLDEPGPGRFLQHLTIGHDFERGAPSAALALAAKPRPALRTLHLDWQNVEGVAAMWAALPNLRDLLMPLELADASVLAAVAAALTKLERLVLSTGDLDRSRVRALASATWPSLVELDIENSYDEVGEAYAPADLAPLLDGRAPKLSRLAMRGMPNGDELCEQLATSHGFAQLETLDLSRSTIGERGARALLGKPEALAKIALVLDENYIPEALHAPLSAAAKAVSLDAQRDDGGDPARRFVTAYE